jgi:hypothetical protein
LLYVSFKHILIILPNFMGTPNSYWIVDFLWTADVLSHCTPIFLQYLKNAENLISSWSVTLKPTADNPQQFNLCMDLTLKEGYSIKLYMKLIAVLAHYNYYSLFFHPFCEFLQ